MFDRKIHETANEPLDLRHGMKGSLTAPIPPLAGAGPFYALQDPPLASPAFDTPAGQVTHG